MWESCDSGDFIGKAWGSNTWKEAQMKAKVSIRSPTTIVLYWCSGYLTAGSECKWM